ncbi:hypothetical protein F4561_003354 [Lipingzhangella halophila]|uniref:Uncharacterized protein n=1 Tax=Lipingzhangella halophila TaxID=1783352 RepID=A0A7W7W468_9ACTN|nr:hypothetical protein [Lipingzhangella halophila]
MNNSNPPEGTSTEEPPRGLKGRLLVSDVV